MKKIVLCCLLLLVCCWFCGYGQMPDWVWARGAVLSDSGIGEGRNIATDQSNNVYVTGLYKDTITFGSHILTTSSGGCFYLAKYDEFGNVLWARSAVNSVGNGSFGYCISTDLSGNIYATGEFGDTVSFGSYTLTSTLHPDVFLVKYDSSGNVLWAKSAGGNNADRGCGVCTDRSANVYVTGYFFSQTIVFGNDTLINTGSDDIFIAKYDSSGNVLWARRAGGTGDDVGVSVATDAFGRVYITGSYNSSPILFGGITLTMAGYNDIFIAQYDSSGNIMWAKGIGGSGDDGGASIAADSAKNIYITGSYSSSSLSFGSHTINNAGSYDSFIAKYDSSGRALWAKNIGGTNQEAGYSVACNKFGKPFITGYTKSTPVTFDTVQLQIPGVIHDPMFLAAFDSSGHGLWGKVLASGGIDNNTVSISPLGCIYVGGDFYVNPIIIGNDSLHLYSPYENVFVAKLCYSDSGQGIPETINTKEFILYPNPFDGKLNVSASPLTPLQKRGEEEEFVLYDVTGRLLLRCLFTNQATINTEQLARGLYIYEIADKNGVGAWGKAVKQ